MIHARTIYAQTVCARSMGSRNTCSSCFGNGSCAQCDGSGIDAKFEGDATKCPSCSGTGVCPVCNGTGAWMMPPQEIIDLGVADR